MLFRLVNSVFKFTDSSLCYPYCTLKTIQCVFYNGYYVFHSILFFIITIFEIFYIFICFKIISNWLSVSFYEECFLFCFVFGGKKSRFIQTASFLKSSLDNSTSDSSYWYQLTVFSTSDFGFLAFSMASDFLMYCGHFSYYIKRVLILFKSTLASAHPVRFSV